MLKELILKYGKDKINTLTKYPSILTLHKLGEKGKLLEEWTTPIGGEKMFASEKIDGTNVRIIVLNNEFLIGSRDNIIHYSGDLYYGTDLDIVENVYKLQIPIPKTTNLTIIFGELFGGKINASKNYGTDKYGFRVFDIVEFNNSEIGLDEILNKPIEQISRWREHETHNGLMYGQNFLSLEERKNKFPQFEYAPELEFDCGDFKHETILNKLKEYLPETKVALSDKANKKPEGIVLRNFNRTKIVKLRFEDYERTLKNKNKI